MSGRPPGMSDEEWVEWVREKYQSEKSGAPDGDANGSAAGFWRPTVADEVFEPGRFFRLNQSTGISEVFEPPGVSPPEEPAPAGPTSNGHDAEPEESTERLRHLRIDIGQLNKESPIKDINAILDRIAAEIADEMLREDLLKTLKLQTEKPLGLMRKRIKETIKRLTSPPPPPVDPEPGPTLEADWHFDLKDKTKIVPNSQHNIRLALQTLGVSLSYDQFADRNLIHVTGRSARDLDDPMMERLWLTIDEKFHFRPTLEFFSIVLRDTARYKTFHPVLDYIDAVKLKCDGIKRLDNWLFTYGKAPKGTDSYNKYVRTVGRIMLIAAIRRLRQPGCKFDEVMVFVSEKQGTDKSTALVKLAVKEEWFTDSIDLGASDKQAIEQLQGKWIVELPEMRGRRRNDADHVKAFLSRTVDRARLSYGRFRTDARRQCIYFGSTNDLKFLRDRTGNRRFWPIIGVVFDTKALEKDIDQLWAEAALAEEARESIRLPRNLWAVAETVQGESLEEDPWTEILETALENLTGKIRAANVWLILDVDAARRTSDADNRMGYAMRELGWTRKQRRYNGAREWSYIKGDGVTEITCSRDFQTGQLRITQGTGQKVPEWTIDRGKTVRIPLNPV